MNSELIFSAFARLGPIPFFFFFFFFLISGYRAFGRRLPAQRPIRPDPKLRQQDAVRKDGSVSGAQVIKPRTPTPTVNWLRVLADQGAPLAPDSRSPKVKFSKDTRKPRADEDGDIIMRTK